MLRSPVPFFLKHRPLQFGITLRFIPFQALKQRSLQFSIPMKGHHPNVIRYHHVFNTHVFDLTSSRSTIALIVASVRPAMAWTNCSPTISRANQPFKNRQRISQIMADGDGHAAAPGVVFQ